MHAARFEGRGLYQRAAQQEDERHDRATDDKPNAPAEGRHVASSRRTRAGSAARFRRSTRPRRPVPRPRTGLGPAAPLKSAAAPRARSRHIPAALRSIGVPKAMSPSVSSRPARRPWRSGIGAEQQGSEWTHQKARSKEARASIKDANGSRPGKVRRRDRGGVVSEHHEVVHLEKIAGGDLNDASSDRGPGPRTA